MTKGYTFAYLCVGSTKMLGDVRIAGRRKMASRLNDSGPFEFGTGDCEGLRRMKSLADSKAIKTFWLAPYPWDGHQEDAVFFKGYVIKVEFGSIFGSTVFIQPTDELHRG